MPEVGWALPCPEPPPEVNCHALGHAVFAMGGCPATQLASVPTIVDVAYGCSPVPSVCVFDADCTGLNRTLAGSCPLSLMNSSSLIMTSDFEPDMLIA